MDAAMAKPKDHDIPLAFVREALDLDPAVESGTRWKQRPRDHFPDQRAWTIWNTRYAGKSAGSLKGNGCFHIGLTFDGRMRWLKTHRVVFALTHGHWPKHEVDHIHGVEAGHGSGNLRAATRTENQHNVKISRRNTSGYLGVSWSKERGRWRAQIVAGGRGVWLGYFDTPEEAFAAYLAAKRRLHLFAPTPRGFPVIRRSDIRFG